MPVITGLIFLVPMLIFIFLLEQVPDPAKKILPPLRTKTDDGR